MFYMLMSGTCVKKFMIASLNDGYLLYMHFGSTVSHFAWLVLVNSTEFLADGIGASDLPQNRQSNNFAFYYIHKFH